MVKQRELKIKTKSCEETISLGKRIGEHLSVGDLILISGELGAGKTTLIKGIALGLCIDFNVKSPSFTIVNEYKGKHKLYHIDLYRVEEKEFYNLGFYSFLEDGIVCIEWADKLKKDFKEINFIKIDIKILNNEREINLIFNGEEIVKRCIVLQ